MADRVKFLLDEDRLPTTWYNLVADLPSPPPPVLHPGTLQPIGPDDLAPLFPMSLIQQEASTERDIEIPEPVRDVYRQWRPAPLHRARRLERALQTPARIYYKYEGVSPAGSPVPTLTRGRYAYDFGDTAHLTPLVRMHTLGSTFMPPGFHAGGLRYHGMAPLVSHLKQLGLIEAQAPMQASCFEAGVFFARQEGIIPAPEATHAIRVAIDEAMRCREDGVPRAILFNLSGHGHFDMQAYTDYFAGKLGSDTYDERELAMALSGLPSVPGSA